MKAEATSCAAMAYVLADLHREGAKLGKLSGGGDVVQQEAVLVSTLTFAHHPLR